MKRSLLSGVIFLLVTVGTVGAAVDLDKTVSIKVSLSMTWSEFCLLEDYFKTKLAEEVIDEKNWKAIDTSRIILHNLDEHCPAKDKVAKVEGLVIYISKPGSKDVDVSMTKKTYIILHYVWANGLDGALGKLFQRKLTSVKAHGSEAPDEPSGMSEFERTFVAIGVASAAIAALIIVLAIVFFCKKISNQKKNHDDGKSGYRRGCANNAADNEVLEEQDVDNSVAVNMGNGNEPIKTRDEDEESTKL